MSDRTTNLLQDLVISRILDAPRHLVWKAWTDPQIVMQWWGPKGFTAPACKIDLRVGGQYLYCMRTPDGQNYWTGGEFTDIQEPTRIASRVFYADENGEVPAADPNDVEVHDTVTLEELPDGKTRLTIHRSYWDEGEDEGFGEIFDKFADAVAALVQASK